MVALNNLNGFKRQANCNKQGLMDARMKNLSYFCFRKK